MSYSQNDRIFHKITDDEIMSKVLPNLIKKFGELLKEHDYPIQGSVDFYGIDIPYCSDNEKYLIEDSKSRFNLRALPIIDYYTGVKISAYPDVMTALRDIKTAELNYINSWLVHKFDTNQYVLFRNTRF